MKNFLLVIISLASVSSYAGVSANVSFTTDYIWRGMTQSDGPAVQGGFDYEADSGFYAGFGDQMLILIMVMVRNLITMQAMVLV